LPNRTGFWRPVAPAFAVALHKAGNHGHRALGRIYAADFCDNVTGLIS
jgi:hypothetical protein